MDESGVNINTVPFVLLKRRKRANKDIIKQQRARSEEIRKRARTRQNHIRRAAYFISVS